MNYLTIPISIFLLQPNTYCMKNHQGILYSSYGTYQLMSRENMGQLSIWKLVNQAQIEEAFSQEQHFPFHR